MALAAALACRMKSRAVNLAGLYLAGKKEQGRFSEPDRRASGKAQGLP